MPAILIGAVVLTLFIALAMIAMFSGTLGQRTCRECGGGLPVPRLSNLAQSPALDDWVCSKCGTRFDRQARARI